MTTRSSPHPAPETASLLAPEDEARAGLYGLLANLLAAPPHPFLIASLAGADALHADPGIPEGLALSESWDALRSACQGADAERIGQEWHALFSSTGKPQVVMNGSWYLTGFLMEKPLAVLRDDLAALGLARRDNCTESEDHLAAVCDVMRVLVVDVRRPGDERLAAQRHFFDRHLRPWVAACCNALATANDADFYRSVGRFAATYFALEGRALHIES